MNYSQSYIFTLILIFSSGCEKPVSNITEKSTYMESLVYPYPVKHVELPNEVELAYIDEGRGDYTLLFIHGLGSYLPAWTKNIAALKADYRCVALDLPNYGRSRPGNFFFSMTFFARTIDAFIQSLQLKNVILVGHSMGGQIAMTMILDMDTEIKKLVLIAPAGFETFTEPEKLWLRQAYTPALILSATPEQIQQSFDLNFATNQLPQDAEFMYRDRLRMLQDLFYYTDYSNMIAMSVSSMLEQTVFDRLNQLNLPTLIIYGQEDLLIPNRLLHPNETTTAIAERGAARIRNSELSICSPCGHFVQWECAGKVNDRIRGFVR